MRFGNSNPDLRVLFRLFRSALINNLAVRSFMACGRANPQCMDFIVDCGVGRAFLFNHRSPPVSRCLATAPLFAFAPRADTSHLPSHNCSFHLTCFTIG